MQGVHRPERQEGDLGGRAFVVNGATAEAPAGLSIQDSVGGATVTGTSGTKAGGHTSDTNNVAGGVLYIDDHTTLNIYGGTYSLDVKTPDNLRTSAGGILAIYKSGTLKILVLGNSHSLDATNLLYEVFFHEAPEQKVVIGALYYSGCSIHQHDQFLTDNTVAYKYYKNDGTQPSRKWVMRETTCLDALQDEQWDYIFMQQMNNNAAIDTYYTADKYSGSWKVVADYLMNNQDIAPKLGFHMVWTNPDDYELYLNDDAPYKTAGSAAGWRNNHELYWAGEDGKYDQSKQYQDIVRCVQQYLVNDTSLVGRPFDLIESVNWALKNPFSLPTE